MNRFARLLGVLTIGVVLPASAPARAECHPVPAGQVCVSASDNPHVAAVFATEVPHLGPASADATAIVDPAQIAVEEEHCLRLNWPVEVVYCSHNLLAPSASGGVGSVRISSPLGCVGIRVHYLPPGGVTLTCFPI